MNVPLLATNYNEIPDMQPRLITLEGIDGAGKSTHLTTIRQVLTDAGLPWLETREPGGTPLAETLRSLVLSQPMTALSETLLMFAARHDHVERVIGPALARGQWVLSDRFVDASYAYQGGGRGVAEEQLVSLEAWVVGSLQPDLTFWFDLDPDEARLRLNRGRGVGDRFEQEQRDFFERVRGGYQRRFQERPDRLCVIDAGQAEVEVSAQVKQALEGRLIKWLR